MATVAVQVTQQPADSVLTRDALVNVLHFDGGQDYNSIGQAVLNAYNGNPPSGIGKYTWATDFMSSIQVRVYDLADLTPRPERWFGETSPGGINPQLPHLLCGVLSFYAGRNINGSRGRIFCGTVPSQELSGDQLSAQGQGELINLGKALYATDGGTWNHVVYSVKNKAPTPTITNYFASSVFGVQHSRSLAQVGRSTWVAGT